MTEHYLALRDGRCCYRRRDVGGPTCLLLHGATVGGWEFDLVAERLARRGITSVGPDLFGHGGSDRPNARFDLDFFAAQVEEFAEALGLGAVYLVGHSLGAAVAARLALRARLDVSGVVLAAPLFDFESLHPMSRAAGLPGLGPIVTRSVVLPGLRRRRRRHYRAIGKAEFLGPFFEQFEQPGFASALHRLFRDGVLGNQAALYEAVGRVPVPCCLLRGEYDSVCPPAHVDAVHALTHAPVREIGQAGHSMLLTHPVRVTGAIEEFVSQFER